MSAPQSRKQIILKDTLRRYRSFPTAAVNHKGEILIAYREAVFNGKCLPLDYGEHGVKGDSYIAILQISGLKVGKPVKLYDHRKTGSNEQHAILSGNGAQLYLFSRQWGGWEGSTKVFFSRSEDGGKSFVERKEVVIPELSFMACYGRLREVNGRLITPVYGFPVSSTSEGRRSSAAWIVSENMGDDWKFGGWISRAKKNGASFNETAILPLGKGRWLAALRSADAREKLYLSFSNNGLKSWSVPEYSGFRGEAPELYHLGNGKIGLTYRGFSRSGKFSWSLKISGDGGKSWGRPKKLSEYGGSRYHGGYGDVAPLGDNRWLGICYAPGPTKYPGIEGRVFALLNREKK